MLIYSKLITTPYPAYSPTLCKKLTISTSLPTRSTALGAETREACYGEETINLRGAFTGNAAVLDHWTEYAPTREGARCSGPSKECRPIIHVVYEAGGEYEMTVPWRVQPKGGEKRAVMADVRLDGAARSEVLAALTGNEALRGRKGKVALHAKELFGLMRLKGIGMGLYRWYTEVV